jgi:hypothetical protein
MAVEVPAQHGVARFNVADAGGYHGARKCNLFALEIAHRAGFAVPIVARPHGVGFPGADGMARQVGEGKAGSWATVADGWAPGTLGACRARGGCMLAVTSAPGRAQGHVVVVDRVDEISRGENGGIRRLRVTGWDAGARGARYRSVTLAAIGSGGRFDEIHLVALRPGKHAIWTGDASPGASVLDLLRA